MTEPANHTLPYLRRLGEKLDRLQGEVAIGSTGSKAGWTGSKVGSTGSRGGWAR